MSESVTTLEQFKQDVYTVFTALDMNNNQFIDEDEAVDVVRRVLKNKGGYDPESFREQYALMDKNADGKISKEEFEAAVLNVAREGNFLCEEESKAPVRKITIPAAPEVRPLTGQNAALFRAGLQDLGKTFNNARHAFLTLSINEKGLDQLEGIERFKYLQNVYVAGNGLKSLECLSCLKHLVRLDASNNQISNMLDFGAPACLDFVDYSHNQISKIENVDKNKYLKELYLDDNKISKIEGLKANPTLRVLSMN